MDKFTDIRLTPEIVQEYINKGYWTADVTLRDYFLDIVRNKPERLAVVAGEHRLNYGQLADYVTDIINGFLALGIKPRDRVAWQLPSWIEGIGTHYALRFMNAVAVPIIPIMRHKEIKYIVNDTEAKAVIIPSLFGKCDYPAIYQEIKAEIPTVEHIIVVGDNVPEGMISWNQMMEMGKNYADRKEISDFTSDPCWDIFSIMYTSGTTADPKGCRMVDNALLREYKINTKNLGVDEDVIFFMGAPITHISGLSPLEMPIVAGGGASVYQDVFVPTKAAELIQDEKCNIAVSATPFLQYLCDVADQYDLSSMTKFVCGGAYIPPELIRKAPSRGIQAVRTYGGTEQPTSTMGFFGDDPDITAIADGHIVDGWELKIVDDDGNEVPNGEDGEILVKGPELFVGYTDEKLNEEAFTEDGYFRTGDIGRILNVHYVQITGRKKDIIIRGGENLSVKEVEDLLFEHPAVENVAIVGMPDKQLGEKACAYIMVKSGQEFNFDIMLDFLRGKQIAKQKYPERLEIVTEFPTTASGKIQKNKLREMITEKIKLEQGV